MAFFSDEEKSRARFHMGVPDSARIASRMAMMRSKIGISFQVDTGLELLNETGRPRVLELLARMDEINQQYMKHLASSAEFNRVGDMERNRDAFNELVTLYDTLGGQLAGFLGVEVYIPLTARGGGAGNTLNGRWC